MARFFMLATYKEGSVAEMSLGDLASYKDADRIAKEWLETFDHGFNLVAVVSGACRDELQQYSATEIHERITILVDTVPESIVYLEGE